MVEVVYMKKTLVILAAGIGSRIGDYLPILNPFTDVLRINSIMKVRVTSSSNEILKRRDVSGYFIGFNKNSLDK